MSTLNAHGRCVARYKLSRRSRVRPSVLLAHVGPGLRSPLVPTVIPTPLASGYDYLKRSDLSVPATRDNNLHTIVTGPDVIFHRLAGARVQRRAAVGGVRGLAWCYGGGGVTSVPVQTA